MKSILFTSLLGLLLAGCVQRVDPPRPLYQDATGETAKLRVIGFTDYTTIHQIKSCTESSNLHYLRPGENEKSNLPRVIDKGFKKAVPAPANVPLDYQERYIPAQGWLDIRSALFASDGGICTLRTSWFKPEKDALYEVRNRLNREGNMCSMEFVKVDQVTGGTESVKTAGRVAQFLPCETITTK
ncbi:hypothetical protein MXF20_22500 [Pantoea dispersa]|uniref:hypothetical protein n=1 Tax=Pantoea dispersa TaxID=59814 RepID=UPI002DB5A17E|nr:hypothetical protein [Pantoea dispersa]MEB5974848.1 hypothetical protein [Pantoea dispersa]